MLPHREPPDVLGKYRIVCPLAAGGMGSVYLAHVSAEHGFSRTCAIKVLHPHLAHDVDTVDRFLTEARVAALLVHPNIVPVLDAVSEHVDDSGGGGRWVYLVLEYVHGDALSSLLRETERRSEPVALDIALAIVHDALEGLDAAHAATDHQGNALNLVHRDISPHNILVSARGSAYLTDFGIAKVKDRLQATESGAMVGKPGYLSPEQLGGDRVSAATDLWAMGVVLWETLAGRRLYEGMHEQVRAYTQKTAAPSLATFRDDLPEGLDELVRDLVAVAPTQRPATARAALDRLAPMPRASRAKVADWVLSLSGSKLDRIEAFLRQSATPTVMQRPSLPPTPSEASPQPGLATDRGPFADTERLSTPAPVATRRRAAWALLGAIASLAVGAFAVSLIARGDGPLPARATAAGAPLAPRELPSSSAEAVPPRGSSQQTAPVRSEPVPSATLTVDAGKAAARKPERVAPSPNCVPPYEFVDGVKRYKRECL